MKTQIRESKDMADKGNGHMAAVLHGIGDVNESIGKMSRQTAAVGYRAVDMEARPARYASFPVRAAWITTGKFAMTALTETPPVTRKADAGYITFLSAPTWIRTGVFSLGASHGPAIPHVRLFDGTWITTGVFELTGLSEEVLAEPREEPLRLAA